MTSNWNMFGILTNLTILTYLPWKSVVLQESDDLPVPDINMLGSGIQRLHASVENTSAECILTALSPGAAKARILWWAWTLTDINMTQCIYIFIKGCDSDIL